MFQAEEEHSESAKQPKDFNVFVLRKPPFDILAQSTSLQVLRVERCQNGKPHTELVQWYLLSIFNIYILSNENAIN